MLPYTISGNTLVWSGELSPYTGLPYWTATGNHNTYAVIGYHPDDEMVRNFGTDVSPFTNTTTITDVGDNVIRISYSWKNSTQTEHHKPGTVFALCGNAQRETAGAFTWESKNVLAESVNVHFMHGFGWLIQMSEDVTYAPAVTIRDNTFYIKTIGDTYWDYKSAIYIHPVTYGGGLPSSDEPIHKNITIEGNTYDDGMKNYAVIRNMPEGNLSNADEEITVVTNSSLPADDPVSGLVYVSSDPDVVSVDADGQVTALSAGTAEVYAYYVWDKTITKANSVTFTDPDGDAEGRSLYLWTCNGHTVVTDVPEFTVTAAGELTCAVYPVDAVGTPGIPVEACITTPAGDPSLALNALEINGTALDVSNTEFEVLIPVDLGKVEIAYQSLMPESGLTFVNGEWFHGNSSRFGQDVAGQDAITIQRVTDDEEKVYTINLIRIESNATDIHGIEISELSFAVDDLSAGNWLTRTTESAATLKVLADDTIGHVEVRYNNYRTPVAMTRTADGYEGNLEFINGLNSYYVTVEAVSEQKVRIRVGDAYVMDENSLTVSDLQGGSHDVYVMVLAEDGIVRCTYHVELMVPYEENVELFTFTIDGNDVLSRVDENGSATVFVGSETAEVRIVTKDSGASIRAVSGSDETSGTGDLTHTVKLADGEANLTVTITARDGVTSRTYSIDLILVRNPDDASRDIPVEVLTATAGDWQTGYEAVVTEPTCTEGGYTTYTCACGDSYVGAETEALGHDWKGTSCQRCGETRENPFVDVPEDSFYIDPVLWAVEEGITTGLTATTFGPTALCNRAQVVTFLYRAYA